VAGNIKLSNLVPIDARSYFAAIDSFGSPADDVAEIRRRPEAVRDAADFVLVKAERLALVPATPAGACPLRVPVNGVIELSSGPGTIVLQPRLAAAANVLLRRFAATYSFVTLGPVAAGGRASVTFPRDGSSLPWHIQILAGTELHTCAVA
jgi:hypothetical protein